MTRLAGEFRTNLSVYEAIVACAEAIEGIGWHIEAVEANRIVSRADTGSQHPPKVEVVVSESGQATHVRIIGTDTDAEPLSKGALIAELDRARHAIEASLEGATGAPPREAPPPFTMAPKRHPDPSGGAGYRWVAGIIAGLIAIGLGIIGVAIVNDSSEPRERVRGGFESTGTPQSNNSQSKNSHPKNRERSAGTPQQQSQEPQSQEPQSQEPAVAGLPGLGETAEIRDGDQHFALTPTAVAREGSYITLEIEVAGLGNGGYDTTGREFLGTLFGSNGQRYAVESSGGSSGCEPPKARLTNGQTRNGCLPFKVPQGVEADTFQYEPFFIGGDRVKWDLK